MKKILTMSVDKALKIKVERVVKRFKASKSELVKKAIEKYIGNKEFRELKALLIPYAEKAEYDTDEDAFKDIS